MDARPNRPEGKEVSVLVLQGGGALGAYQAGAYEALAQEGYQPDWVAGISIGAINGAIIAGNVPEKRGARLRTFWERVSSSHGGLAIAAPPAARGLLNGASALWSLASGAPGFFAPRLLPPMFASTGGPEDLGFYSSAPLRQTLAELVDFDVLNGGGTRLSAGAVNVRSGNFAYFDTRKRTLAVDHIMASGALPPGLPPVEVDGEFYWDGGVVSNTPLQYVLDEPVTAPEMNVFQVDLFSARGTLPETLLDAVEREKEIRYSSRTRLTTDMLRDKLKVWHALQRLLAKLPEDLRGDPDARLLQQLPQEPDVSVVHLIYRARAYEGHSRDYEFSRASVEEHWEQGRRDVIASLKKDAWCKRSRTGHGMRTFDLTQGEDVR